jgi:hypothetical protein
VYFQCFSSLSSSHKHILNRLIKLLIVRRAPCPTTSAAQKLMKGEFVAGRHDFHFENWEGTVTVDYLTPMGATTCIDSANGTNILNLVGALCKPAEKAASCSVSPPSFFLSFPVQKRAAFVRQLQQCRRKYTRGTFFDVSNGSKCLPYESWADDDDVSYEKRENWAHIRFSQNWKILRFHFHN